MCLKIFKKLFNKKVINNMNNDISAVVIGMEKSKFAGRCAGAEYDATRINTLLSRITPNLVFLKNETATKDAVKAAFKNAVKNKIAIFYYSGHGANQKFSTTGPEEADGKDDFLCLYDTYMLDNEIWEILKSANGRVFLIFDCCHSSDMFRIEVPFSVSNEKSTRETASGKTLYVESDEVNAIQWAGCHESTVSWGSSTGGMFTNAFLKYYNSTLSYNELWNKIANDKTLLASEIPYQVIIGKSFIDNKIFS